MMQTLLVGDFILVNKYTYGIRIPVLNHKVVEISNPQRGDVMVFRYPENPAINYIKRVVGLPGDVIEYRNKQLYINGTLQTQQHDGDYNYVDDRGGGEPILVHTERYVETLGTRQHAVLINPMLPDVILEEVGKDFPHRENCSYSNEVMRCTVPPHNYFMMGDNRDNSRDSRYWGFVPDDMIVGKAFGIWMNWGDFKRIGMAVR
jgi:signal peptidase I